MGCASDLIQECDALIGWLNFNILLAEKNDFYFFWNFLSTSLRKYKNLSSIQNQVIMKWHSLIFIVELLSKCSVFNNIVLNNCSCFYVACSIFFFNFERNLTYHTSLTNKFSLFNNSYIENYLTCCFVTVIWSDPRGLELSSEE